MTTASATTAVPSSASLPTAGGATIFTLASVSPSVSTKPKSSASKGYGLSSPVVTVLSAPVGAALVAEATRLTSTSVPTVRETPEGFQVLAPKPGVPSARTREVLPTTRVRAAVAVVKSGLT